ncbi:hypothetical protein Pla52o_25810 [Novipirellula galeiformis]|uniref:GNT-I family protein n=1 Tax=Novipirellula galeiformis TaxID=2528004 RepID=A0A5C6CH22_9BACT|nr:glycosyltransferase family 2 protein [Novipirellula galeiformis]TWU23047.1 hypothetical protein Pla52o_25810 [Novipirellula galeiformis]
MLDIPIAFIVFNRPAQTRQSFAAIRKARPKVLCIISDGPRSSHPGEAALVEQSRQIAESCDWPCEIQRFYSDTNLGCGERISSGLTAVFEQHEQAIVLEDDCVPNQSFFRYCNELLQYYEHDERVMAISGDNFHDDPDETSASYFFSKYPHCWGWATWRRAWKHYEGTLAAWPEYRDRDGLASNCHSLRERDYWTRTYDRVCAGEIDSWAIPWMLACWMNHGLTAVPARNLVSNIGFGDDATHTTDSSPFENLPTYELDTIVHPDRICRSVQNDVYIDRVFFSRGKLRFRHLVQFAQHCVNTSRRAA